MRWEAVVVHANGLELQADPHELHEDTHELHAYAVDLQLGTSKVHPVSDGVQPKPGIGDAKARDCKHEPFRCDRCSAVCS